MAADDDGLQVLPLGEDTLVRLHLGTCDGPFEAIGLELTDEVVEDQGVGTLAAVLGQDADQQQVDGVGLVPLQGLQQRPPAEGQEPAVVGLAQRLRERGEGDAEAYHLIAIHDSGHQVQVGYLDVVVHELVDLTLRELGETVEILIGGVQQMEHLTTEAFIDQFLPRELMHAEAIALLDQLGGLRKLIGHHLRNGDLILQVVVVLQVTPDTLDMLRIIGVVVVDVHRGQFVETLDEQTFAVGIDETQGAGNLVHALFTTPVLDGLQQGRTYLDIIDEVEPAETDGTTVPTLIGTVVDDRRHAASHLSVFISQEVLGLTAFKRRVLVASEGGHLIGIQKGHGVFTAAVKVVVKLDKLFQLLRIGNFLYLNHAAKVQKKVKSE